MGDEKQQQDHKVDLEHVNQQVGVIDATNAVSQMLNNTFLGGGVRFFGKTNFEGHQLNHMIDMVESANPDHLESAGQALWDARDAINDAAEELSGHVGRVDWEGEAGSAFRTWGGNLVNHARDLATFAEVAGTQITAAATGLASVRKSMPPRDARTDPKTVADIPAPARLETNDEYAAAVQAEDHRQEAINQMNRLSSFYAVSEETLAAQEPPTFEPMPGVGVPKPDPSFGEGGQAGGVERGSLSAASESGTAHHQSADTALGASHSDDTLRSSNGLDDSLTYPDRNVGTEIDSVGTLPPQETARPTTGAPPSVTGLSGAPGGTTVPPFGGGSVPPAFGGPAGRTAGFRGATGSRAPILGQGRASTPGGTSGGRTGRGPMGPVGRAAATGQAGGRGATTAAGKSPMGRSVAGGVPRAGGTASGRVGGASGGRASGMGATGAGRTGGVVGGRPTTAGTAGTNGSRMPRGTVVGGEGAAGSRTTGERPGQRGVIGTPNPTTGAGAGQTPRRSASNPDGVVGAPKGRVSGAKNSGFTSGGTGLVRGPVGSQGSDRVGSKGTSRREQSTEDETRPPSDTRRDVPRATD
ncbi:hypothetical protein [Streptomyces sp. NBC_00996]|uniref:WXG100 family type VII secretion target n=1 Tax=Streptomyces sp. NBC_00996 TaxID=2903710 RepID=UPI00386308FF|nr:hypothetical protein OG390_37325 [Streptomyces sp. NBC_00996]